MKIYCQECGHATSSPTSPKKCEKCNTVFAKISSLDDLLGIRASTKSEVLSKRPKRKYYEEEDEDIEDEDEVPKKYKKRGMSSEQDDDEDDDSEIPNIKNFEVEISGGVHKESISNIAENAKVEGYKPRQPQIKTKLKGEKLVRKILENTNKVVPPKRKK